MSQSLFITFSFLLFTLIVALYSYRKTKGISEEGVSGFFLAGRGLSAYFIVGSLLLSNLSAEQLIGLNGNAYRFDISGMAWESTAAIATIIMALFFLPRYLKRGLTTIPEFLEERFDAQTRRMISMMCLIGYVIMANPVSLYLGSITIEKMFHIQELVNIDYFWVIAGLSLAMGAVGGLYAAIGGLKAVAISDTINGVLLLLASLLIPVLGLMMLGDGNALSGMEELIKSNPEQLNAIGGEDSSVPFSTIFTGMIAANLFYWCTNQMIIQRTLGAKSLSEGQKGVLFAGSIKLIVPIVMVLPGLIAFKIYGDALELPDLAYPTLVKLILPWWLTGLFAAALFGTVISHFNSIVNASATLFALDFYRPLMKCNDEKKLVKVGKMTSMGFALISIVISPLLLEFPSGIFDLLRRFTGFYNIPVIAIVLVGFLTTKVPAKAAKFILPFHIVVYSAYNFIFKDVITVHYIHLMGILFVLEISIMLLIGHLSPSHAYVEKMSKPQIPMAKWRYAEAYSVFMVAALVLIYVTLSPLGIANPNGVPVTYPYLVAAIVIGATVIIVKLVKSSGLRPYAKKTTQTVKIDDVALHARVSPSTVSLYIRKPEKVSKKTGDKIQKSIDELGYVYNKIASQFTGSKSKSISVIVPSIANEVISDILQQLEELVSPKGFQLKIASHDHNLDKEEEQVRSMLEWSPSILIITGQEHTDATNKMLKGSSATVIQLLDLGGDTYIRVGLDHEKSGFDTTQYLIDSGCKKIAYFSTRYKDDIRAQKRHIGYCEALRNTGQQEPVLIDIPYTRNSYEDTRRHLSQALANHRGIDGIVATNDAIGIGVILEATQRGIEIPEKLSVIGFGDFSISSCLTPISLSSVNLNSQIIAEELANLAFESFHDENFVPRVVDTGYSIIPRDSTKLIC